MNTHTCQEMCSLAKCTEQSQTDNMISDDGVGASLLSNITMEYDHASVSFLCTSPGGEVIHAEFNIQLRIHNRIRNEVHQLVSMMRNHLTKCSPAIQAAQVRPRPKKKLNHH